MKTLKQLLYSENTINTERQISRKINSLKETLAQSDYKVIKCMEASLANQEMPYDVHLLHYQRQMVRREINLLEERIQILKDDTVL